MAWKMYLFTFSSPSNRHKENSPPNGPSQSKHKTVLCSFMASNAHTTIYLCSRSNLLIDGSTFEMRTGKKTIDGNTFKIKHKDGMYCECEYVYKIKSRFNPFTFYKLNQSVGRFCRLLSPHYNQTQAHFDMLTMKISVKPTPLLM